MLLMKSVKKETMQGIELLSQENIRTFGKKKNEITWE